jgi:hypothetical protein
MCATSAHQRFDIQGTLATEKVKAQAIIACATLNIT